MNTYYETVNEDGETDIVHDQTFQVVRLKAFFAAVTGFITVCARISEFFLYLF